MARKLPVVTRRSAGYLVLVGILILALERVLFERPEELRLQGVHLRKNIDIDRVRLAQQALGAAPPDPDLPTSSTKAPERPPPSPSRTAVAYSRMRIDRSGSVLHDVLLAHAYCFAHSLTYGGSCAMDAAAKARSSESQRLVDLLGLSNELKLACPYEGGLKKVGNTSGPSGDDANIVVLDPKRYKNDDLFTAEWLRYVSARRSMTEAASIADASVDWGVAPPLQVAVYLRRGDVTPCFRHRGSGYGRYLPNAYYLRVLDHYVPSNRPAAVRIYSLSNSPAEDFDAYLRRNYTVLLDTPIREVWEALMTADFAVLSRSSFSYVPAIFNARGTVLYTDFWHKPLPWWVRVNQTIQERGEADLRSLQDVYCPKQ
jgi:hypothetical protein